MTALAGCTSLKTIELPSTCKSIICGSQSYENENWNNSATVNQYATEQGAGDD